MKILFASAIALSLLTGTAMAAPVQTGQSNGYQNQQHNQQVQKPNVQHQAQHSQTVKKTTRTSYTVTHARGEYRYNGKSYKAVKASAWRAPRGYEGKQTFHRGQNMPAAFRDRAYVVDYRAFHLNKPAVGYQWVRVSNNAYLVNQHNGLVAQIVWSMFN